MCSLRFTFLSLERRQGPSRKHEVHKLWGHKGRTTASARGVIPPLCPAGLCVLCTPHDVLTQLSVLPEEPCVESERE